MGFWFMYHQFPCWQITSPDGISLSDFVVNIATKHTHHIIKLPVSMPTVYATTHTHTHSLSHWVVVIFYCNCQKTNGKMLVQPKEQELIPHTLAGAIRLIV